MSRGVWLPPIAAVADFYLPPAAGRTPRPHAPQQHASSPSAPLSVTLVLCAGARDARGQALGEYARAIVARGTRVALLTVEPAGRSLRLFQAADNASELNGRPRVGFTDDDGVAGSTDPPRVTGFELPDILDRADHLLIGWFADERTIPAALTSAPVRITVVASGDERHLADAYRTLKYAAATWRDTELALFLTGAPTPEDARRLADRVCRLAAKSLGQTVDFDGFTLRTPPITHVVLAQRLPGQEPPALRQEWIDDLAGFVGRHAADRPDSPTPSEPGNASDESLRNNGARPTPPVRHALPLAEQLRRVEQLDAVIAADLGAVDLAGGSSGSLTTPAASGVILRLVSHAENGPAIVASTLDARLPLLETALTAARGVPAPARIVLVTPNPGRYEAAGQLLACPLRLYAFEQISLEGRYGLLLPPMQTGT